MGDLALLNAAAEDDSGPALGRRLGESGHGLLPGRRPHISRGLRPRHSGEEFGRGTRACAGSEVRGDARRIAGQRGRRPVEGRVPGAAASVLKPRTGNFAAQ